MYETIPICQRHETVANGYRMPVIGVGTVRLQVKITGQSNKVFIKNVVLNSLLHARERKESLISEPCPTEKGLKVKFDIVGTVIIGQHGIEGSAKRVNRMYVIYQYNDSEQAHVVTTGDIHL